MRFLTGSSRVGDQNSLIPKGYKNLNFRLARDQVLLLETVANLYVRRRQLKAVPVEHKCKSVPSFTLHAHLQL